MISKPLLAIFLFFFSFSFSQEKVTPKQIESAYNSIFQQPDIALEQLQTLQERSKHQKDSLNAIVLGHIGVYYAVKSNFKQAVHYFDLAIKKGVKGSKSYVNTLKNKAIVLKKMGQTRKAIQLLKQALVLANQNKYSDTTAIIYGELGSCYSALEDFENALYYLIKSIELWEKIEPKDPKKIIVEKQKLANLYFKMDNSKYALQLYGEILPVFKANADFYNYYLSQITVATIYLEIKQPAKALPLLDEALLYMKKLENIELLLYANERRAKALELLNRSTEAKEAYKAAFEYGMAYNQPHTVIAFIELGNLLLAEGKMNEFLPYVTVAETLAFHELFELASLEDKKRFYEVIIAFYEWQGANPNKIELYKKLRAKKEQELQDKLNITDHNEKLLDSNSILAEKDAVIQSQKKELDRIKLVVLIVFVVILLVLVRILYSRYQYKEQLLHSSLDKVILEKLLMEALVKPSEAAPALQNIEVHGSELLSHNLKGRTTAAGISNKLFDAGGSLRAENIVVYFDRLYPQFNSLLVSDYPQLTEEERHICWLMKLHLSPKEIAHLLQIHSESILTKKHQIVSKLQLPKEIDFQTWLSGIGS